MKKSLLSVLGLAMALVGSATTTTIGSKVSTTDYSPVPGNLRYVHSGSQLLYTPTELQGLYTVNTDGTATTAKIKSLSFTITTAELYEINSGSIDAKVYLRNVEDTEFAKNDSGKYPWLDYSTDACTGSISLDSDAIASDWEDAYYGGDAVLTINLNEAFTYTGQSILITICLDNLTDDDGFYFQAYTFVTSNVQAVYFYNDKKDFETVYAGGVADSSQKELPELGITYENTTIALPSAGGEGDGESESGEGEVVVTRGDATKANIGTDEDQGGSTGMMLPLNTDYKYSLSQTLFTATDLQALTAAGNGKAEISDITAYISLDATYIDDSSTLAVTVYAENTEATAFPTNSNGKAQWFEYSTAIKGTATIDSGTEGWEDAFYGFGGEVPVKVHFDEPIMYDGNSLLLTWISESSITDYSGDFIGQDGTRGFKGNGQSAVSASDSKMPTASGNASNVKSTLPYIEIAYVPVTETVVAPTVVVRGEATKAEIGEKEEQNSSTAQKLPLNADYKYSLSQTLFTATDLQKLTAAGNSTAEISDITAYINIQGDAYPDGSASLDVTVYAENTEATAFPTDGGKTKWFEYSTAIKGTATINTDTDDEGWAEFYNYSGGSILPVKVHFDEPIMYDGNSLLLTWISESNMIDYNGDLVGQEGTIGFSGNGQSAVSASDSKMPTASGNASSVSKTLPYLEIYYVPITEKSGASQPVSFTDVKLNLAAADNGKLDVYISFNIDDPVGCTDYEIKMNNTSLGTISEKTGYIHYLASSYDQDVLLQIVPNGDGAVSTNYSVAAEDFSALFPACEISAVKADFAAEYNAYNDRSTTMEMVAMFHFDVTTPVAELKYVSAPTPAQARIVTADTDLNDNFASYMPSKDWNDLVGNNGNFSLYCSNYSSPKIERGEIVLPETATMTIYYSVNYPISVATTPVLSTSAEEAVPAKATTKDVVVAAPNAGYSGSFMGRFNVTADNFHGDVTMPSELCYKSNDDGSLTLFGPAGTKIYYKISKQEAPNLSASYRMTDDFVEAPTNPYTLEAEEIQGTFISSYTADAVTGDVIEEISMSVSEGGEVSGISDITIDGAASSKLYDLRGIEITDTPAAGIYIRRTGSLTEKVIIK